MEYEIREMRKSDWEYVSNIYTQSLIEGKATFQTKCPDYETWDRNHLTDCRFVMVTGETVIGFCTLGATSARDVYRGVVEVSIYFDSEYRGLGLGSRLLKYLCKESEKKGYWCLYVAIFSINKASIHIHKKCGFREIGYREKIAKDRFGKWQNTTLLERRNGIE
jgi:phosphinothricin acetyltransferase